MSQVGTADLGAPGKLGPPWCLVPTRVRFVEVSYFPIFLNIPKLTKNIFADFRIPFTYRITCLLIFMILECFGRTLLCDLPVTKFG